MMAYSGGDSFPCVVAEIGSYSTKMGFAGEDYPRSYFRSSTALLRDTNTNTTDKKERTGTILQRSYDFATRPLNGGSPNDNDGSWEICNPIDRATGLLCEGLPTPSPSPSPLSSSPSGSGSTDAPSPTSHNSNDDNNHHNTSTTNTAGECYTHFSTYLNHGYQSALGVDHPSSSHTPLLLIERSYNPPPIRQKTLELIFEEHQLPATFFARDAVCAGYAVGRTTATVVDVGYGGTVVTPVYEGFVETKGVLRSPVGAAMMEETVLETLDQLYRRKRARTTARSSSSSVVVGKDGTTTNGVEYAMPLYQTRVTNYQPRREPFHTAARLDMARMCREEGSGAGVAAFGYATQDATTGDGSLNSTPAPAPTTTTTTEDANEIYQQYANAPKIPYKLPDGTVLDIPQTKRFDVAELLFGKDLKNTQRREESVMEMEQRLAAMISSIKGAGGTTTTGRDSSSSTSSSSGTNQPGIESKRSSSSSTQWKRNHQHPTKDPQRVRNQPSSYLAHQNLLNACLPHLSSSIGELTSSTIPSMVCDSAFKCDRDQQTQLLGNVVLCGGGACLSKTAVLSSSSADYQLGNAMTERIREEVEAIVHTHTPGWRVKVLSPGLAERAVCSWLGGSILGSLGSFHEMWITKKEYDEYGAAIVNRKCP